MDIEEKIIQIYFIVWPFLDVARLPQLALFVFRTFVTVEQLINQLMGKLKLNYVRKILWPGC